MQPPSRTSRLARSVSAYISLGRPKQQVKNLLVFAPLVFSYSLGIPERILASLLAFVSFCLISASVYAVNDAIDRDWDRIHPIKRQRPVASGEATRAGAIAYSACLAFVGLALAYAVSPSFLALAALYLVLVTAYSLYLKHVPIADLLSIGLGFVLRILAGVAAVSAPFSPWITGATFFLSIFIISLKRKKEISLMPGDAQQTTRKVLGSYTRSSLEAISNVSLGAAVLIYALYAFFETGKPLFCLTLVPMLYVIWRFKRSADDPGLGLDDPTDIIFQDSRLLFGIGAFVILVLLSLYVV
ncbi:MAG TPA: UbiA family prenyltransferase [Candidatus Paceibacterota bacterium]|nr:UbiA family prenyltransferase [Candidatus Paceibacterota bacterium]